MEMTPIGGAQTVPKMSRAHREIADKHTELEHTLAKLKPLEASEGVIRAAHDFEAQTRSDREQLLKGDFAQTREEVTFCEWFSTRYDHLSRMARTAVSSASHDMREAEQLAPAWAHAILLAGHSAKWRKIAGQRTNDAGRLTLHQLFKSAQKYGVDATIIKVNIEGQFIEATVEALYVRALLLERFASGNLSPKRLEILDNWLIQWSDSLWLTREPILDMPALAVDTTSQTRGFVRYEIGDQADYFLALVPLQRQLDRAVADFHRGVIFPNWGVGTTFRMDEHIAVIDFLEREFSLIAAMSATKSKRFAVNSNLEAEVHFGLNDICNRALYAQSTRVGTKAIGVTIPGRDSMSSVPKPGGPNSTGAFSAFDPNRRPLAVIDVSETGLGLEIDSQEAGEVDVDDLIAVRLEAGRPAVLGVVARKAGGRQRYVSVLGVRVLAKMPLRATLEYVSEKTARPQVTGIFVAGNAENGFGDSLVISDTTYRAGPILSATVGSGIFQLRLGRVRNQGRGWKMVSFDVIVAR